MSSASTAVHLSFENSPPEIIIFRLPPEKLRAILFVRPHSTQNNQAISNLAVLPNHGSLQPIIAGLQAARRDIAETIRYYTDIIQKKDEELVQLRKEVGTQSFRGDYFKSAAMRLSEGKEKLTARVAELQLEVDLEDQNAEYEVEVEKLRAYLGTNTKYELKAAKLERLQRKCSELEAHLAAIRGVVGNPEPQRTLASDDEDEDEDVKPLNKHCRLVRRDQLGL